MSHTDVKDLKRRLSHFNGCFNEVIIIRVLSIISIHTAGLSSLLFAVSPSFVSIHVVVQGSCRELKSDIKIKENTFPVNVF